MPSPSQPAGASRSLNHAEFVSRQIAAGADVFDLAQPRSPDPIFDVVKEYQADSRPELLGPQRAPTELGTFKINMSTGVNMGSDGAPAIFSMHSIQGALEIIFNRYQEAFKAAAQGDLQKLKDFFGYLPTTGHRPFCDISEALLFGANSTAKSEGRLTTIQTVGGTGALAVGAAFLKSQAKFGAETAPLFSGPVYISQDGWPNHLLTFRTFGYEVQQYPYLNRETHSIRFDGLKDCLTSAPSGSIFVMQLSGHNSSSFDFSKEQWAELADIFETRRGHIICFFDAAYAGLKDGFDKDCAPLRLFADRGIEFLLAHSFSKSLEAYGLRLGTLSIGRRTSNSTVEGQLAAAAESTSAPEAVPGITLAELTTLVADGASRALISNCPRFGAELLEIIFKSDKLRAMFEQEVADKAAHSRDMRSAFAASMQALGFPEFEYVKRGSVLFAPIDGIDADDNPRLRELGVHMYRNRLVLPRLNINNIDYFCQAIATVLGEKRAAETRTPRLDD